MDNFLNELTCDELTSIDGGIDWDAVGATISGAAGAYLGGAAVGAATGSAAIGAYTPV